MLISDIDDFNNINLLGSYLSGLIEGDGTIITPKTIKNDKGKKNYPSIRICFNIKDYKLASFLEIKLGGNIWKNKTETFCYLTFNKIDDIIIVVNIINGYFRTPKIAALFKLIKYLNLNYNLNIELKEIDYSCISSNSWLTGFSDADANFNLTISKRKNSGNLRVMLSFRIEINKLKIYDINENNSYNFICSKISNYFGVSLYSRERKRDNKIFSSYLIVAHNYKSHLLVCNYFNKYPLLSSKFLNFKDWELIVNLQQNKLFKSTEYYNKVIDIKNKFNNKRIIYSWNHLYPNYQKLLNKKTIA